MDFNKVLSMAAHNEQYSSYGAHAKRYSTDLPAPKKPPKSNVQSDAVKAFLAKKQKEEQVKAREFERKKTSLLELRSIAKHNRKATAMAKRTKDNNFMANFSFLEELMKNGDNPQSLPVKKTNIQKEKSPPYRESEKSRCSGNMSRPKSEPKALSQWNSNDKCSTKNPSRNPSAIQQTDRKSAPARRPPPPQNGLNFHELLKLAAVKQHQPVDIQKTKKIVKGVDFQGRLMTNDEKRQFIEEQTRKQGRSFSDVHLPGTSRSRKKFRRDEDEGEDLVVSNLTQSKAPQNVLAKSKVGNGIMSLPPIKKLSGESQRPNAELVRNRPSDPNARSQVPARRDRMEQEKRHPNPKQNTGAAARNGQKSNVSSLQRQGQPSASKQNCPPKQNYPTKPVQVPQRHSNANQSSRSPSTSRKSITDERTKVPVRPIGSANGKVASTTKRPSQCLPQNRDTNGQSSSKMTQLRDPAALRKPPPSSSVLKKVPNRDPLPKQLPSKPSVGKQVPPRSLPPKQGPTRELVRQFPPRDGLPKQFPPRDLAPRQFPPRDLAPKQFPPRDLAPKQFPPRDLMPKQFPPRDLMPKQFPPRDGRGPPPRPIKRRIESDDEYDDEMDDFIDDGPLDGENTNISAHIKEIFGYDRNKYRFEPEDDLDIMESSFAQQMREEALSTKMGILEDLEDIRREQEELKGKFKNAKKKKK